MDTPITVHFDGSWRDEAFVFSTTNDPSEESFAQQDFRDRQRPRDRFTIHTEPQCTCAIHTSCLVHPRDPRPTRVRSERVGPLAIGDSTLRPDRVLYTWPMIVRRAQGWFERELFEAHAPHMKIERGLPWCQFCEAVWPCPNAEEILQHFGLTEHDLDFRPEDNYVAR